MRRCLWLHGIDICTGKTECLSPFLTQHTRKSIGRKEAFSTVLLLSVCTRPVSPSHCWPIWLLCVLPVSHPTPPALLLPCHFSLPSDSLMFVHMFFLFHSKIIFFLILLPHSQIMQTTVLASAIFQSLLTNFFFSGLSVSQPFLLIFYLFIYLFLCLIFILKFKKQLNGVQEQQDPFPPLTHTSHSFLQDHTSPGLRLQSQCPGRPNQAPYPVPPLTRRQLLR